MSREIPQVVRAAAGLAATVLDEARKLPSLPIRVIGIAMQVTMRVQQQYSGLVARGDEVFTGLRGEAEPGLATFDEDLPPAGPAGGTRASAFDRAAVLVPDEPGPDEDAVAPLTDGGLVDDEVSGLPDEPAPEEVVAALEDIADEVQAADLPVASPAPEAGLTTEDALETALLEADGAPDDALVDGGHADASTVDTELVAEAPTTPPAPLDEPAAPALVADAEPDTAATDPGGSPVGEQGGAPDVTGEVDVLTPDGGIATVEGTVTDEGIAAPETAAEGATGGAAAPETAAEGATGGGAAPETAAEDTAEGAPGGAAAEEEAAPQEGAEEAGGPPIDGYDSMTIAQLRGRLRGYQLSTVVDLLAYEEAHAAREPFLRMLRNRLEKLERQAVESSPLAPRGA